MELSTDNLIKVVCGALTITGAHGTRKTIKINEEDWTNQDFREWLDKKGLESFGFDLSPFRSVQGLGKLGDIVDNCFVRLIDIGREAKKKKIEPSPEMQRAIDIATRPEEGELDGLSLEELMKFQDAYDYTNNTKIIVNRETKEPTQFSYENWDARIRFHEAKAQQDTGKKFIIPRNPLNIIREYNPRSKERKYYKEIDGLNLCVFNEYIAPSWHSDELANPHLPAGVGLFLKLAFPNPTCRAHLLNWIRNLLLGRRNGTAMVLHGARGVGKNTLADLDGLIPALIGKQNAKKAPKGFLSEKYNGVLFNTQFLYCDEEEITPRNYGALKSYMNPQQTLHFKHQNATVTRAIETNFCISSNKHGRDFFYVESNERRMSVYDMRSTNLVWRQESTPPKGFMSPKEMDALKRSFEDEEVIANTAWWIIKNCKGPWDDQHPWKGPRFDFLVQYSLKAWQRAIWKKIKSRESDFYSLSELNRYEVSEGARRITITPELAQAFLDDFRYEDQPVGDLIQESDTPDSIEAEWGIAPTGNFMPATESLDIL